MVMDIGRICVKLAGRDAGKKCVIFDVVNSSTVLIDGQTRRRKCNINHLEPTNQLISLKKGASHAEIQKAFETIHLPVPSSSPKQKNQRPHQQRKQHKDKSVPTTKQLKAAASEKKVPPKNSHSHQEKT